MTHRHTTRRTFLASAAFAAPGARAHQAGSPGPTRIVIPFAGHLRAMFATVPSFN